MNAKIRSAGLCTGIVAVLGIHLLGPLSSPVAAASYAPNCEAPNSHSVAVGVDYIRASDITDDDFNPLEREDEIYFLVNGAIVRSGGTELIELGERKHHNIREKREKDPWYQNVGDYWCVGDGEVLSMNVTVREDDDLPSPNIGKLIGAGAAAIGAAFGVTPLLDVAKDLALSAAKDFVHDLEKDRVDDTLDAFMVTVSNRGGTLSYDWRPVSNARMKAYNDPDGPAYQQITDATGAMFNLRGGPSNYTLKVSGWVPD
jgi:hypothetical protein